MTNFGERARLTVAGVPVGRLLPEAPAVDSAPRPGRSVVGPHSAAASAPPAGSCIVIVITDAPIDPAGCQRLARRAGLGLARTGSTAHHGSGEIFLALATGLRAPRSSAPTGTPLGGRDLDPFFEAVVDATEESVLNSLLAAPTVIGRSGNRSEGLPPDAVRALLAR